MKRFVIRHKVILAQASLAALLVFLLVLSGCFSSNPKNITAFAKPSAVDTTAENYILQPPDEVEIHCSKVPEVHMQSQKIRPDGKISFEGVGEIQAAGKTPKELTSLLYEKIVLLYALTGENPIDVRVVVYQSKFYYVLGEVDRPGPKICTGRDSALAAIAAANPTALAWKKRIQVIRPSADKKVKPKIFELNFDKLAAHGDASKNVLLEEGDIIFVPPTILASVGKTVQEFLAPITSTFSTINVIQRTIVGPATSQSGP
jgi:protein involved in polysaccharide export with SLBB domain